MSEGNTAHTEIRVTLDAVKKASKLSKWAADEDTVLKAHLQSRILQRTIQAFIPLAEEQVRNISNKENEVLNKDKVSNGG